VIRQHDVQVLLSEDDEVLGEGTFRVVLTRSRRVVTAIDIPDSALGPLHLVFAVSPQSRMASTFQTGSLFGDLGHTFEHVARDMGHGVGQAAEATFNAGSKVATTLARPAFDITRDAAAAGASLLAHVPFVPGSETKKLEAASRTILRARLGDVNAQQFIRAVGQAAKAGEKAAQRAGDALLDGTRIVARVLDTPLSLVSKIPTVGGFLHELDPLVKLDHMADKLKHGDFEGLKTMIENDAKMAQGIISLFPGIGTGISAALGAGIGVLEGGGALDIALETAYGAIPIPPGIRETTDAVLGAILKLIHHPHNLTDALLAGARNVVPAGMARDVFDTLARLVIHHMPIAKAGGQLVDSYVQRYAPGVPLHAVGEALGGAVDAAAHHKNVAAALRRAAGDLAKKAAPGALGEGIAGVANVVSAVAEKKNVGAAIGDAVGSAVRKIAPVGAGEALAGAAHVAGVATAGRNIPAAMSDVLAKYLPAGVGHGAAPFARGVALANTAPRAIPLPSSLPTADVSLLSASTGVGRSALLLPAGAAPSPALGAALSAALGLADAAPRSTSAPTTEPAVPGLAPAGAGPLSAVGRGILAQAASDGASAAPPALTALGRPS
jgi:hypothetical protein